MANKTELIFGYGSLMSCSGIIRNRSDITLLDAFRAQIIGHRGFSKPCLNGKIYCMDVDDFNLEGIIEENYSKNDYIEGLVININQDDFSEFSKREGYNYGNEIISNFSEYNSIGEALWTLFQKNKKDNLIESIISYREKLYQKVKGTSIHYIPHPILFKNFGYAIAFIAPGKYGTGNVNIKSEKEKKKIFNLLNAKEVLERIDIDKRRIFLKYVLECLYGGVHGINIRDIIDSIPNDLEFMKDIKNNFTKESIIKERDEFSSKIFNNLKLYKQKFGSLSQNLIRSGLNSFLPYDIIKEFKEEV